ncbi:MAG TPA: DUF2231 domain-containing protein [Tepidisphaeraceae bacterium]|nr:DUF2231 domain-containing protein [Tepidisphaeraceae bacterium]
MPQLINPNLHVILIHYPIALLFIGTAIEVLAFMWRRSSFRAAGRWMILIGALATMPAITTGMYAARQAMAAEDAASWSDLKSQAHLSAEQWDQLSWHIRFNSIAAGLLALLVVIWLGSSDRFRHKAHPIFLIVLLAAVGLIAAGAWRGGELVYAHSTGVGIVKGGWPTSMPESSPATTRAAAGGQWAFDALNAANTQAQRFDAALDIHAMLAGWVIAFALVTLGLSLRALSPLTTEKGEDLATSDDDIVNAIAGRSGMNEKKALAVQENADVELQPLPHVPAARFWLLTALLVVGAVLFGWMVAGPGSMQDAVNIFQSELRPKAHIIAGVSLLVLSLILALVTRFARHNKFLVGCFAILLTLALAAQVWFGWLLLFDASKGSLTHFN